MVPAQGRQSNGSPKAVRYDRQVWGAAGVDVHFGFDKVGDNNIVVSEDKWDVEYVDQKAETRPL
jgi:hypothetical protein